MEHGMNTEWGGRASSRDPNFARVAADSERWGLARTLALPCERNPCLIRVPSVAPASAGWATVASGYCHRAALAVDESFLDADAVEHRPDAGRIGVGERRRAGLPHDVAAERQEERRDAQVRAPLKKVSPSVHTLPTHRHTGWARHRRQEAQHGQRIGRIGAGP